jgi:RNA polymerase sigma-70 factor (ECF subfamily)
MHRFDLAPENWPIKSRALIDTSEANCDDALGEILNACRTYLLAVADAAVPGDLGGKIAPSDLVQETLLEAHQGFEQFHGRTREELLAWLRCILRNNLLNSIRRFRETASRQVSRECEVSGGSSHADPVVRLADPSPGPRSDVIHREEEQRLIEALGHLPSVYREVIELHNRERMTFAEVGKRIGRSAEAARKLWARAIEMLRAEMR